MKKILVLSIIVNVLFISLFVFVVHRKGGISYIKRKLSPEPVQVLDTTKASSQSVINSLGIYWFRKKNMFEVLPNSPNEIIFLGNSITEGCEWAELLNNPSIRNRGIGGDNTQGVLLRLSEITDSKPQKIFIEIGLNDLWTKNTMFIIKNYTLIIDRIKTESPNTKIYIQSVLPVGIPDPYFNDTIIALNKKLKKLSKERSLTYINLFDSFKDKDGFLKKDLTNDGIHLLSQGYVIWKGLIEKYVNE